MSFGEFIQTPNTVGLWHLNGNSNDSSGNGLNGTDTAITYGKQYGKFNDGALFNGSNSVILLGSSSMLNLYSFSHTSIIWINIAQYPASRYYYLFARGIYALNSTQFYCRIRPDGKLNYAISSNQDSQYDYAETNSAIPKNTWNCLITTWDKTSRMIKNYLNGAEFTNTLSVGGANLPIYTPNNAFYVGANYQSVLYAFFKGSMDELIFENRIWTPQEIQKYYTNALGRF